MNSLQAFNDDRGTELLAIIICLGFKDCASMSSTNLAAGSRGTPLGGAGISLPRRRSQWFAKICPNDAGPREWCRCAAMTRIPRNQQSERRCGGSISRTSGAASSGRAELGGRLGGPDSNLAPARGRRMRRRRGSIPLGFDLPRLQSVAATTKSQ
jgi:hypothetical protein